MQPDSGRSRTSSRPTQSVRARWLAITAVVVAALAALLLAIAGPGVRLGLWNFGTGFGFIRWAAYGGVVGAGLSLLALGVARPRGRIAALLALAFAVGALTFWLPWSWRERARQVPPIHDVTTDTDDPPTFVAVLPLREGAPNSAEYGGDSIAALQRRGYPEIAPMRLPVRPDSAFARAQAAARGMGWDIVAVDTSARRIEATATTRWFGFKDDVVIRVRPDGTAGSRIDMRSVSRVGGSDVGANAARIRAFMARLAG